MTIEKCEDMNHRDFNGFMNGDLTAIINNENNETRLPFSLTWDDYKLFFEKRDFMQGNDRTKYNAQELYSENTLDSS